VTVRQLVYDAATPVTIIGASTGKTLKRNVTTETLGRNPKLGTLNVLGVQTSLSLNDQLTCWVDEQDFKGIK
jgi:hypothetical protein